MPRPRHHVFVCSQSRPPGHPRGSCAQRGSAEVLQEFWARLKAHNLYDEVSVTYSGCLGPCNAGVNVVVYPEAVLYSNVTRDKVAVIFDEHLVGGTPVENLRASASAW